MINYSLSTTKPHPYQHDKVSSLFIFLCFYLPLPYLEMQISRESLH